MEAQRVGETFTVRAGVIEAKRTLWRSTSMDPLIESECIGGKADISADTVTTEEEIAALKGLAIKILNEI